MNRGNLMEEAILAFTALGVVMTTQEASNVDNLMLAWCLAGSVGAGMALIWLHEPEAARTRMGISISSSIVGLIFGPFTMAWLNESYSWRITMANCLAISAVLSFATVSIFRPLMPIISKLIVSKLEKWFALKLDEKLPTKKDE